MMEPIKVLVVDDAAFMRKAVTGILDSDPGLAVVGTARNGREALERIAELKPDVVTLDIDMPIMDGLTAIRHIMIECPVPIVVLSSMFADGAVTFDALRLGVVDFMPKPSGAVSRDIESAKQQLIDRTKIAAGVRMENVRRVRLRRSEAKERLAERYGYRPMEFILSIGTSLGGPNTVIRLLSQLPIDVPAAVVVVQEIAPQILPEFVRCFDEHTDWRVSASEDGQPLEQGVCYIHSNARSLEVQTGADGLSYLSLGDPAPDPLNRLFASAAEAFGAHAIGVMLTGTGDDGARGFARIREQSGVTIAQDQSCCVYPNLTDNVTHRGLVDLVIDEKRLPDTIRRICAGEPVDR